MFAQRFLFRLPYAFRHAEMQKCKYADIQSRRNVQRKNAEMRYCKGAEIPNCRIAEMLNCRKNAGTQKPISAEKRRPDGTQKRQKRKNAETQLSKRRQGKVERLVALMNWMSALWIGEGPVPNLQPHLQKRLSSKTSCGSCADYSSKHNCFSNAKPWIIPQQTNVGARRMRICQFASIKEV